MKIVLLGYMGSGKSTIGKHLGVSLQLPFIDLDTYIEKQEKRTITTIFKEEGEIYFRLKEHEYLKEILAKDTDCILALGGGTPCYAGNMDVINASKNTTSIYLRLGVSNIVKRLEKETDTRPLLARLKKEELHEYVAKHLFERSFFYEQALKKVTASEKTIEEIVVEIKQTYSSK